MDRTPPRCSSRFEGASIEGKSGKNVSSLKNLTLKRKNSKYAICFFGWDLI